MPFTKLATLAELPDGTPVGRTHGKHQVCLARVGGEVFAINDVCTHAGAPLHEGDLGREGACILTCPWHDAHFDLRTGKALPDSDWAFDTDRYPVEVRDGEVWVDL